MSKIKITQIKGIIKCSARQKQTVAALGLKRVRDCVKHEVTPQILGMVEKVKHLVTIEKF